MKKIAIGSVIFLIIGWFSIDYFSGYKVLKVIDGDTIYVDLNRDNKAQKDEKIRIKSIDAFETKYSYYLTKQALKYNISKKQALGLGYLGKEFAKKKLLGKRVKVQLEGKGDFKRKLAHINILWRNYEKDILKAGLADVFDYSDDTKKYKNFESINKIKHNAKETEKFNLVLLNLKNNKYHKPFCKYAKNMSKYEILQVKDLPQDAVQAGCCERLKELKSNTFKQSAFDKNKSIQTYIIHPGYNTRPSSTITTKAGQAMFELIESSQKEIYIALYGFTKQYEIYDALISALDRGVKVYAVFDMNLNKKNPYSHTYSVIRGLKEHGATVITDYESDVKLAKESGFDINKYPKVIDDYLKIAKKDGYYIPRGIMHNKILVVDGTYVLTGSANLSTTGIGGYNFNEVDIIKSSEIASLYKQELNQMLSGKFHKYKKEIESSPITLENSDVIEVYFSPQSNTIDNKIIPILDKEDEFIYIPAFFLSHYKLVSSIKKAHDRGVDVKIIVDALAAKTSPKGVNYLNKNKVPLKAENFAGKMHMKTIITSKVVISGSMNLTKSATKNHDENTVIKYSKSNVEVHKKAFLDLWNTIPSKWLNQIPKAESPDSINSCKDGIDNDHNGYIDLDDFSCQVK